MSGLRIAVAGTGDSVFIYKVDLVNRLVEKYDRYIAYSFFSLIVYSLRISDIQTIL